MEQVERARALLAEGRRIEGLTQFVPESPTCRFCAVERRSTPALVVGHASNDATDVPMCDAHFATKGAGLGPSIGQVLIPTGPALDLNVPNGTDAVGYAWAILEYRLCVLPPEHLTFIAPRGGRRTTHESGQTILVLPAGYRVGTTLADQLEFALRYDGVSLQVLDALFRRIDLDAFEGEVARHVEEHPTGQYVRRLWFLYEFLTGRKVPVADASTGNYVPLLDPNSYYTTPGFRSRRHRVVNNLLGNADFCPTVRRTDRLAGFEAAGLASEAARIIADYDEDAIRRAVSYLYTKETRSSFDIEGERPSASRTERYVSLLRAVPNVARLTRDELLRLQNATVDPRYADHEYRSDQVYVGEQVDLARQRIHFIAACPDDVPRLMEGLLNTFVRIEGSGVDPIVLAAALSFGFVFIHPFQDGNGRLHRLLIHYVLARTGFTPQGLIFPVSAVMLARRHEYDAVLEAFSVPLMRLVDYDEDADGVVTVKNCTAHIYRFIDATVMAEALYGWVQETVREEFRRELEFVVTFRDLRRELEEIVELPDRKANLFIKLCLQNRGRLPPAKRRSHFGELRDDEIAAMEGAVEKLLGAFRGQHGENEGSAE